MIFHKNIYNHDLCHTYKEITDSLSVQRVTIDNASLVSENTIIILGNKLYL